MKKKLFITTTIPLTYVFFKDYLRFLNDFFNVTAISSERENLEKVAESEGINWFHIPMKRNISLFSDMVCLLKFIFLFVKEKPTVVHGNTPKASMLSMVAAKIACVKVRIYMCHGLKYQGANNGLVKKILMFMEKLTCASATEVICVSHGTKNQLLEDNLCDENKAKVIHYGSAAGINVDFFSQKHFSHNNIRQQLEIAANDFVFVFLGRIVKNKGINELIESFVDLQKNEPSVNLILVGTEEEDLDPISPSSKFQIANNKKIHALGWQQDIRPYINISDVLVLPSYREGFGMVVIEAGAMGVPAIVTDISGLNEIIVDGENGIIIPPKNKEALFRAMSKIIQDHAFYDKLKNNARPMIESRFERSLVWNELLKEYNRLIEKYV